MIVADDASHQPLSMGSGFFVGAELIATNLHVLEGASYARVKGLGHSAFVSTEVVAATDELNDLVILRVPGLEAPALPIAKEEASVGDTVYAIGNPEGLEGTFSQGIISAQRKLDETSLYQITAPLSPGSSGGPVINESGFVIGVAVATLTEGQNLNFAVPSDALRHLLTRLTNLMLSAVTNADKHKSRVGKVGADLKEGVTASDFKWDSQLGPGTTYTLVVRNSLPFAVSNVRILVVFETPDTQPLDVDTLVVRSEIPAGLARMASQPYGPNARVKRETTGVWKDSDGIEHFSPHPAHLQYRVLSFDIAR
jgi:S1-C subfamily serine protease